MDKHSQIVLFQREIKNKVNLLLTKNYLISPEILQKKFQRDKKDILTSLGLNVQKIRQGR
jgi:hypothetical protein